MSQAEGSDRVLWAIPSAAEVAWLDLQAGLEEVGSVPCRESHTAAWWPDKRDLNSPTTHGAIAACRRCPLQAPCAAYAIAADERFGVWGGTTPDDRRAVRRLGRQSGNGRPGRCRPSDGDEGADVVGGYAAPAGAVELNRLSVEPAQGRRSPRTWGRPPR